MKKIKGKNGFTLIEILIVLFLLSIVLLAISTMVYSVMRATAQSRETTTATALLQDKLESLKHQNPTSLTPGSDAVRLGNVDYLREWNISTLGNVKTITVRVNWTSRGPHTVSATTLRGD